MNYEQELRDKRLEEYREGKDNWNLAKVEGVPVEVYYNSHLGKLSIRNRKTKLVMGYSSLVALTEVDFVVQPGGRDRVRRTHCKNVHAWVRGRILPIWKVLGYSSYEAWLYQEGDAASFSPSEEPKEVVVYNPYKFDSFVVKDSKRPVYAATHALVYAMGHVHIRGGFYDRSYKR